MEKSENLKELHNELDKIIAQKNFLKQLSKVFHEIVDDMWKQNEDFIQIDSEKQISKTEYIHRFIKNILYIDKLEWCDEKISGEGEAAIEYDYGANKINLLVYKKYNNLKINLSHELGHLKKKELNYFASKGNSTLRTILEEGVAEESARNNTASKNIYGKVIEFEYFVEENDESYYCKIPQTGYTDAYVVATNIYEQLKTVLFQTNAKNSVKKDGELILKKTGLEEIFSSKNKDFVQLFIKKITELTGNKEMSEDYVLRCICTFETFKYYDFIMKNILKNEEIIEKMLPKDDLELQIWNKKIKEFRAKNKNFENNFIKLQKEFFAIMSKKVEKAQTIEELYGILNSIEYMKPNLPVIKNKRGTNVTNGQIGIFGFQQSFRNRLGQLQEKENCSIIPNKNSIVPNSGDAR